MNLRTIFVGFLLSLVLLSLIFSESWGAGDTGSYIPPSHCSTDERKVILGNLLPLDLIHDCRSRQYTVEGREVTLVAVDYGEAQACSAGCIYQSFIEVVEGDTLYPMPAEESKKNWLVSLAKLPLYNWQQTGFSCNYPVWQTITRLDLEWKNDTWGWRVTFTEPLSCKWIEVTPVDFAQGHEPPNTSQQVTRTWEGSMFVSGEPGELHWVYDKILVRERRDVLTQQGRI